MRKTTMDLQIAARVPATIHRQFAKKAGPFGGASRVLRELIEGWLEGRITIAPKNDPLFKENEK